MITFFNYYLKITFRNLALNKRFTIITIFGLLLGMTSFLLILNYAWFEFSYDDFHPKGNQLYRVQNNHFSDGRLTFERAITYREAGPSLKAEFPEVLDYTRMNGLFGRTLMLTYSDEMGKSNSYKEASAYYVDDNFLTMFPFPLLKGDATRVLTDLNSVVVTEGIAFKYFGLADPIGKTITVDGREAFTVRGVLKNIPLNTHMKFDILFPIKSLPEYRNIGNELKVGAGGDVAYTYLRLAKDAKPMAMEKKVAAFLYAHQETSRTGAEVSDQFVLQPLKHIHLESDLEFEMKRNGNERTVTFLMIMGFLVVFIAWVNYVNLSTARATKRAREVGIRKVVGATKGQLAKQFITEALVLNASATLLSILLVLVLFPFFTALTGLVMELVLFRNYWFLLFLITFILLGAVFSGLYPASIMSSFAPITALKGKAGLKFKGVSFVKAMTVFQYAISIILLAGTVTVYEQVAFMRAQELGVDIERTLVIHAPKIAKENYTSLLNSFREETLRNPNYLQMTASSEVPGKPFAATTMMVPTGTSIEKHKIYASAWVDYDFMSMFGLDLINGRNFSANFATDDKAIIVNEAYVKSLGHTTPEAAIGQSIISNRGVMNIIGVVRDYHQVSLKTAIQPMVFFLDSERNRNYISFRITGKNVSKTIKTLQDGYETMFPGNPFEYFFLDDFFDAQYKADKSLESLFMLSSILALFITCLGLFNLSFITAVNRIKEIAIRKVVGAPNRSIVILLSKGFIRPIALGALIGMPIIWFLLNTWLSNYAYRITLSFWVLFAPALLTAIMAGIAMGYHILKAANSSAVANLKVE